MNKLIKNHVFLLKCLFQVSSWYLPMNLFSEFISYAYFMGGMLLTKYIINDIFTKDVKLVNLVIAYGIYYLVGFLREMLIHWITYYFNTFQKNRIQKNMQTIIYKKVKEIDLFCYEDTDFYNKYSRAVFNIQDRLYDTVGLVVQFFGGILRVISIVYLFATLDFVFIVAAIVICIQMIVTIKYMDQFFYNLSMEETPIHRKINYIDFIFKGYQFVKELKVYRHYDFLIRKYKEAKQQIISIKVKGVKKLINILFIGNLLGNSVKLFVNCYVIIQVIVGKLTIGDFTLIYTSVYTLGETLSEFIKFVPKLKNNNLYIEQLLEIWDYIPEIKPNLGGIVIGNGEKLDISLKNITFSYPNAPNTFVLKNISMDLKSGEKVAIVGQNGSGKSTLVKILLYLYEQNHGTMLCNGIPYQDYNTSSLRDSFGVVFQDFQIYSITIGENVLMREVTSEDEALIWSALSFCGLYEKISSLEKGIYSVVTKEYDDEGVYLSGGELQKLAIARAYVKNASILIFDEPSSALDPVAEHEIFEKLICLGKDKTVIYISHQLASTVLANCIYVLDQGHIIEKGSHDVLMKKKGKYYTMFTSQAKQYNRK